jgi:hypothetical protein
MTAVAAPTRRARPAPNARRPSARPARSATRAPAAPRAQTTPRAATRSLAIGRVGALLAVVTLFTLVTAVVFHVFLAQNQMQLDHLNGQIAKEQRTYEQRRLTSSLLASPQRIIQEAERLGLVQPPDPSQVLYVPDAPLPETDDASTADTLGAWSKTKPSLGPKQP